MKKIIFVCTGNICRSPTAEAVARHKAKLLNLEKDFFFDSAGTTSHHVGEYPDGRAVMAGKKRNISFAGIVARKIELKDFAEFDLVMAMDRGHLSYLLNIAPQEHRHKVKLFLKFYNVENSCDDEVMDPYYAQDSDFDEVLDLLERAMDRLLTA